MNSLQQQIETIRKAIEDNTLRKVYVEELPGLILFQTILNSGEIYQEAKIPKYILEIPNNSTCQTCGKEITGSGYCSKECSNEGFVTELPIQL